MSIGLILATFAVVFPAELPDKTFISAIILSSRYRPFPVWIGAASGLVLQAAIAVVAGRLLALLPHRTVEAIVAGLFLAGAAYLLVVSEKHEQRTGEKQSARSDAQVSDDDDAERAKKAALPAPRIALTTFGIVALAEFGDLTQVVIANFTARYDDPLSVFVGAAAAFILVSALGVAAGRTLTRYVPLSLVRRLSGLALLGLGIWSLVGVI